MSYLEKYPIREIGLESKNYPDKLKEIKTAPKVLYFKGNLPTNQEQCLAIVGTRRASDYGKDIAFRFASELAKNGLIIVSGMAIGIDSFSHQGALGAKGKTIAILGTGLSEKTIYPQENLKLAQRILEQNGCLISEYPSEAHGERFTFLQRNRLIAGLSLGVLVIEAKIKSGALNTAHWAKKQQKPIFAIPGSIYSQNSLGCHLLIKNGATLVEKPQDILKVLAIKSLFTKKETITGNPEEKLIFEILSQGPANIDQIIEKTKLPSAKISSLLMEMEMADKIRNISGNTYAIN